MIDLNKIYNENCLDTMAKVPDDFVDLIITSPPYNMNLRIANGKYCSRQITKEFSTKYQGFDDNLPIDEFYELHKQIIKEMLRISDLIFYNIQIVTGSKRAFFKLIGDYSDYIKDIIIWDKKNAQPSMQSGVLNRQYELLIIFEKNNAISRQFKKCNFKRGTLNDVWVIPREKKKVKNHSATFPTSLVQKIIENFTIENDIIYDPFSGTGTTAVVSMQNNRQYIGSELLKYYYELSINRLNEESDKKQQIDDILRF